MSSSVDTQVWTATGQEPQVFLDASGRRARMLRPLAALLATVVLCGPVALVAGATGFSTLPSVPSLAAMPGVTGAKVRGPVATHRQTPSPSRKKIVAWSAPTIATQQPASAPAHTAGS